MNFRLIGKSILPIAAVAMLAGCDRKDLKFHYKDDHLVSFDVIDRDFRYLTIYGRKNGDYLLVDAAPINETSHKFQILDSIPHVTKFGHDCEMSDEFNELKFVLEGHNPAETYSQFKVKLGKEDLDQYEKDCENAN